MKKITSQLSFILVTCSMFLYSSCYKDDSLSYSNIISSKIVEVELSRFDKNILNFTSLTDQKKN